MKRIFSLILLLVFVFCIASVCSAGNGAIGVWISQHLGANGKPRILFITSDSIGDNYNGPIAVTFEEADGKVKILDAQNNKVICYISDIKETTAVFEFPMSKETYIRITAKEVDNIWGK